MMVRVGRVMFRPLPLQAPIVTSYFIQAWGRGQAEED